MDIRASKMGIALEKKYKKNYTSDIAIKKEFDLYKKLIDKFKWVNLQNLVLERF